MLFSIAKDVASFNHIGGLITNKQTFNFYISRHYQHYTVLFIRYSVSDRPRFLAICAERKIYSEFFFQFFNAKLNFVDKQVSKLTRQSITWCVGCPESMMGVIKTRLQSSQ